MNTLTKSPLILLGVDKYFDSSMQHVRGYSKIDLACLFIKEKDEDEPQMLLFEVDKPYPSDADALYYYLHNNKLNDILVNGGAKIKFDVANNTLEYYSGSYLFPSVSIRLCLEMSSKLWPTMNCVMGPRIKRPNDTLEEWRNMHIGEIIFQMG